MSISTPCRIQNWPMSRRQILRLSGATLFGSALGCWSSQSLLGQSNRDEAASDLIFRSTEPRNAEPLLQDLVSAWITPTERFYIRNHGPIPSIDVANYRLAVEGMVARPQSFTLAELRERFPAQSAVCTMTCAGNRRNEFNAIKPVNGVMWEAGAIGNAQWTGISLSDLLAYVGLDENARHIWFDGLDQVRHEQTVIPFGGSIPIEKGLSREGGLPGTLLATEMNGQPLTDDHGAPLRCVVPGYIGARSVKWLGRIVISDRPSPNHFVADAYKLVAKGEPIDWAEQSPLYRHCINGAIAPLASGESSKSGVVTVQGYALPTGMPDARVAKVELSTDRGESWQSIELTSDQHPFCWQLWKTRLIVTQQTTEIILRVTDSQGNVQPELQTWNAKGYHFNAWYHLPI